MPAWTEDQEAAFCKLAMLMGERDGANPDKKPILPSQADLTNSRARTMYAAYLLGFNLARHKALNPFGI